MSSVEYWVEKLVWNLAACSVCNLAVCLGEHWVEYLDRNLVACWAGNLVESSDLKKVAWSALNSAACLACCLVVCLVGK